MNINEIVFTINKRETLKLLLSSRLDDIFRYDEIKIMYSSNEINSVIFEDDFIIQALNSLEACLNAFLMKNLQLFPSIIL